MDPNILVHNRLIADELHHHSDACVVLQHCRGDAPNAQIFSPHERPVLADDHQSGCRGGEMRRCIAQGGRL
jgi:hypothetical protein